MAGYNWGVGKSNNAVGAEARGLATATETAKAARESGHKDVTSAFINESAPTTGEWHHTSKMFNRTYYYDPQEVVEWLGTDEGADAFTRFKAEAKKAREGRTTTGTVTWVEFEGSGRSKHGVEHRWSGEVVLKGKSIYFDCQRKLLTGNYIEFVEGDVDPEVVAANKAEADEKAAAEERRQEALRVAEAEAKRLDPAREARRRRRQKQRAKKSEARRKAAEQAEAEQLMWEQLADRDETIQGTITWGSSANVRSHTGEITLRDGWAIFDYYPDRTTKIQFFNQYWSVATAEGLRRNMSISEHPIDDEKQEAA